MSEPGPFQDLAESVYSAVEHGEMRGASRLIEKAIADSRALVAEAVDLAGMEVDAAIACFPRLPIVGLDSEHDDALLGVYEALVAARGALVRAKGAAK